MKYGPLKKSINSSSKYDGIFSSLAFTSSSLPKASNQYKSGKI